ncbi:MAG: signal peptidase I [Candidatus Berkelbacteria bacterium]|nr:signal peptidase I [Candidatus Berkelbacteria bacterium]
MREEFLLASEAKGAKSSFRSRASEPTKDFDPLFSKPTRSFFIFFDYIRTALIIIVLLLLLYYLVIQVFVVKGISMDPNFADSEFILVNRISYYFVSPARGDSIVFIFPGTRSDKYIKRIIGLPGERIQITNNQIKINGQKLVEDYIPKDFKTYGDIDYRIKDNEFFVLGDNRELSNDSRIWGPLTRGQIIGRAQMILTPLAKKQWLEKQGYNI